MPNSKTRLFHIGPQKGATTWMYECLKHHPDILAAHGAMFNELKQTWGDEFDEDDLRVNFGSDEDVPLQANNDENVVPFRLKPRVH